MGHLLLLLLLCLCFFVVVAGLCVALFVVVVVVGGGGGVVVVVLVVQVLSAVSLKVCPALSSAQLGLGYWFLSTTGAILTKRRLRRLSPSIGQYSSRRTLFRFLAKTTTLCYYMALA